MRNSILIIFLALFCSLNMTACSLFSSGDDEQESATVAEDGSSSDDFSDDGDDFGGEEFSDDSTSDGGDGEDLDFDAEGMANDEGETESPNELAGEDVEVEDDFGDEYPDDDYSTTTAKVAAATSEAPAEEDYIDDNSFGSDTGSDDLFVDEGGGIPGDTMAANQDQDLFGGDDMEPVVDTPTYADSSFDGGSQFYDAPKFIPVKKMKPAAYKRSGDNVNRLYVVRPGDNMDAIAQKIYGNSSKADDLYKYNSHFRGKTLKVGDKVYYSSPNNPNDQAMMTYYEDNNISPQYYTSQEGDNIRKVSKKLLGHERSWMEIYATNDSVESKGKIPSGLQVRYWPDGTVAPAPIAMNEPEPAPEPPAMEDPEPMPVEPEPVAMNEPEEPNFDEEPEPEDLAEPTEVAMNDPKPVDPAAGMNDDDFTPPPAAGQVNPPPPPKPVVPPPPPPAPKANNFNKPKPPQFNAGNNDITSDPLAAIGDDSMIMGALGGLLILAAIIMLIFIRRSRAKRVNFSQTQV